MEILLDRRLALAVGLGLIGFTCFLAYLMYGALTNPPPSESKYDYPKQLEFMRYIICQKTDAMRIYQQDRNSTNPHVVALKDDMRVYDNMANEIRKMGGNATDFKGCNFNQ